MSCASWACGLTNIISVSITRAYFSQCIFIDHLSKANVTRAGQCPSSLHLCHFLQLLLLRRRSSTTKTCNFCSRKLRSETTALLTQRNHSPKHPCTENQCKAWYWETLCHLKSQIWGWMSSNRMSSKFQCMPFEQRTKLCRIFLAGRGRIRVKKCA